MSPCHMVHCLGQEKRVFTLAWVQGGCSDKRRQKDATGPTASVSPLFLLSLFFSFYHTGARTQGLTCVKCSATELYPSCGIASPSLLFPQYLAWDPKPGTHISTRAAPQPWLAWASSYVPRIVSVWVSWQQKELYWHQLF